MFENIQYTVKIVPARIEVSKGNEIDKFPGRREELVEDALRKLAVSGNGHTLDGQVGVVFTLYELQQELKSCGHTYSINQIKEAINICSGTHISVVQEDEANGKTDMLKETLFSDQTDPVTVMRAIFDLQPNGVKISKLAYLMRNPDK